MTPRVEVRAAFYFPFCHEAYNEESCRVLTAHPVVFLATIGRDGAPKCRPFVFPGEKDGKLWFSADAQKEVYAELQTHPEVEICVCTPQNEWCRVSGKAVFEENVAVKEACLATPYVKGAFESVLNPNFKVFYLANPSGALSLNDGQAPYQF